MRLRANELRLLAVLLAAILVLGVASEQHVTVTNDEPNHLLYGQNILALDSTRFDDSKMPMTALNALPGAIAVHLPSGRVQTYLQSLHAARYPTIVFSLMVGLCVFVWARDLYGTNAGLFALTLYTFDPNLIAHAQLVTTDVYAAGTAAFALYFFWRFLKAGDWRTAVISATTLGLAQVAKYSLVLLFPLFVIIALGFHARSTWNAIREHRWRGVRTRALTFTAYAVMFAMVALLVINASFLFNRTFTPLNQYRFQSSAFGSMQAASGVLGDVPLPLPVPYLEGLDLVIDHERTGSSYGRLYLLGQLREGGDGFPGYYLYASLFKVPLPTLAILGVTAAALLVRRPGGFLTREAVLLLPIIAFTVYFNVFNRAQIGIRYFLVVFPLAYVLCGSLVAQGRDIPRWKALCGGLTLAALVVSVLSYYPYFLPYFNELIGRRTEAYKYLADSNIDWGQYGMAMDDYRRTHPGAIFEPDTPTAGTILVRVNRLTGVLGEPVQFGWLREHFNPVGHVGHGVLVYRVSQSDLNRLERQR